MVGVGVVGMGVLEPVLGLAKGLGGLERLPGVEGEVADGALDFEAGVV